MLRGFLFCALFLSGAMSGVYCAKATSQLAIDCGGPILLSAGVKVMLNIHQSIDPETVTPGTVVQMQVSSDVRLNGKVLIAGGVQATGVVVSVEKIKKKKLVCVTIVAESARAVDGQSVSLTGAYQAFNIPCCAGPVPMSAGYPVSANVLNDIKIWP